MCWCPASSSAACLGRSSRHGRLEPSCSWSVPVSSTSIAAWGVNSPRDGPVLDAALDALLALIAVHATVVDASPLDAPVSADPDDEQFLEAALFGEASWIVSGDKHLLAVSGWSGITVLKPRAFVDGPLASRNR